MVASEELMEMTKQRYILRSLGVVLQGAYVRESKLRRESRDLAARLHRGSRSPIPTESERGGRGAMVPEGKGQEGDRICRLADVESLRLVLCHHQCVCRHPYGATHPTHLPRTSGVVSGAVQNR